MRNALFGSLLVITLALAGCFLTSGQIAISFDLDDPLVVTSAVPVVPILVDLNTISDYSQHKNDLKDIADLALLGEITNTGSAPIEVEFWMTPTSTTYTDAQEVRANGVRAWGPMSLAAGEIRRISWDDSAALFTGRQALLAEIQGDGMFTLYALGPVGVTTYSFRILQGALVVVLDGAV